MTDDYKGAYAGIGSRSTPAHQLQRMTELATALRVRGYVLRSGHAVGADQAFEAGAGKCAEVYLPWHHFGGTEPIAHFVKPMPSVHAAQMAARFHPAWDHLSFNARALHARNSHQVLGKDLDDSVKFVVCWTPDGSIDGRGPNTGGTGQALRIAYYYGIPVFNLQRPELTELSLDALLIEIFLT